MPFLTSRVPVVSCRIPRRGTIVTPRRSSISPSRISAFILAVLLLTGCGASRIEKETASDHTFVDVTYDDTNFSMLVRKDTIDRNDNNVLFWGVNPIFAPKYDPEMQSLYFSLESNYRDERDRWYMEWNLDSRGTAGQKHRLIHGMIPKDNGYGQLLEMRWNRYLFKKAYGDTELVDIRESGTRINTPVIRGSRLVTVIGNAVTIDWRDRDIFSVELPVDGSRGYDAGKPISFTFLGKNVNQTVTVYLFSNARAQRLSWGSDHGGVPLYWKDGLVIEEIPGESVAEFTFSRILRPTGEHVYLAALKGIYARP